MNKIFGISFCIGLFIFINNNLFAQVSANRNYVIQEIIKAPGVVSESTVSTLDYNGKTQHIVYFDGLGRPIQSIATAQSTSRKDIITPVEYDNYGREVKKFLPYVDASIQPGSFRSAVYSDQQIFYTVGNPFSGGIEKDDNPFSQSFIEFSPFNRPVENGNPGVTWQPGNGHTIKPIFSINTVNENIRRWTISNIPGSVPISADAYPEAELIKSIISDERDKKVVEYKDREGKVILKKVQLSETPSIEHSGWLCTYYIYDEIGLLRAVIQPEGVQILSGPQNWNLDNSLLDEQIFRYEYDTKSRLIVKKIPGAGPVYMVYDNRDRLVFTQDAEMRIQNKWLTSLYDRLNRPVSTGMITYSGSRDALQSFVNQNTGNGSASTVMVPEPVSGTLFVSERKSKETVYLATERIVFNNGFTSENTAEFSTEIVQNGITGSAEISINDNPLPPGNNFAALTITYYDNYYFTNLKYNNQYNSLLEAGNNLYAESTPVQNSSQTVGMVTGTKVRVLESVNNWSNSPFLTTVNFYDEKGRAIQSLAENVKNGSDLQTNLYDFSGKVLSTYLVHKNPAADNIQEIRVKTSMEYDHAGRLKEVYKTINDNVAQRKLIAKNEYNELGHLYHKYLAPGFNSNAGLEQLDYDYNIRGWLKGINRGYISDVGNHYFGFELGYDKAATAVNGTTYIKPQYNGNISGTTWKSKGDAEKRKFDYTYDNVNRITGAAFTQYTGNGFNQLAGINFNVENLAYDANGNILSMKQWGLKGTSSTDIDDMTYSYFLHSNKLSL